eukprot:TRINITY_DN269_c0_g1_i1.p1 TRINITY_DN269_c0_g1~~TRINITY_DN269_c0_g1_i1.p1  ORF type:complete len:355 (-),score=57.06 TRINITY_DN269_c0_g1_i1:463-1527(-)
MHASVRRSGSAPSDAPTDRVVTESSSLMPMSLSANVNVNVDMNTNINTNMNATADIGDALRVAEACMVLGRAREGLQALSAVHAACGAQQGSLTADERLRAACLELQLKGQVAALSLAPAASDASPQPVASDSHRALRLVAERYYPAGISSWPISLWLVLFSVLVDTGHGLGAGALAEEYLRGLTGATDGATKEVQATVLRAEAVRRLSGEGTAGEWLRRAPADDDVRSALLAEFSPPNTAFPQSQSQSQPQERDNHAPSSPPVSTAGQSQQPQSQPQPQRQAQPQQRARPSPKQALRRPAPPRWLPHALAFALWAVLLLAAARILRSNPLWAAKLSSFLSAFGLSSSRVLLRN